MKTSANGINLIKQFEGCRLTAYKAVPTEQYFTIGYGHYGPDVKPGMVISQARADAWLAEDLKRFEKYVTDLSFGLNQNQFDALVSFTYNCGPGNLRKLVANRTLADIPDAMLQFNHSGGKELAGLTRRRKAERELFLKGVDMIKVKIAHASIDEHGQIKGGQAGDQTGKEVCIRDWYNKPWNVVIRFKDPAMAEKVAQAMEWAAANNNIGYDQNQRNTLLTEARKYNYDPRKVKVKVETDCSGLVSVACMYAGIPEASLTLQGNCATTRNLKQMLKATGEVDIYTTSIYTNRADRLKRGDILLKEGSHVAVVVSTDRGTKSLEEIAREVLDGKWGNGVERRANLMAAGYNYAMVQAEVNKILKGN